jgi:hypothetical protein
MARILQVGTAPVHAYRTTCFWRERYLQRYRTRTGSEASLRRHRPGSALEPARVTVSDLVVYKAFAYPISVLWGTASGPMAGILQAGTAPVQAGTAPVYAYSTTCFWHGGDPERYRTRTGGFIGGYTQWGATDLLTAGPPYDIGVTESPCSGLSHRCPLGRGLRCGAAAWFLTSCVRR